MITNVKSPIFFKCFHFFSYCCYLLSRKIKRGRKWRRGARKRDVIFHRQTFNSCSTTNRSLSSWFRNDFSLGEFPATNIVVLPSRALWNVIENGRIFYAVFLPVEIKSVVPLWRMILSFFFLSFFFFDKASCMNNYHILS